MRTFYKLNLAGLRSTVQAAANRGYRPVRSATLCGGTDIADSRELGIEGIVNTHVSHPLCTLMNA